jgi:hypothetical protein
MIYLSTSSDYNTFNLWVKSIHKGDQIVETPYRFYRHEGNHVGVLEIGYSYSSVIFPTSAKVDENRDFIRALETNKLIETLKESRNATYADFTTKLKYLIDVKNQLIIANLTNASPLDPELFSYAPPRKFKTIIGFNKNNEFFSMIGASGLHSAAYIKNYAERMIKCKPTPFGIKLTSRIIEGYFNLDPIAEWVFNSFTLEPKGEPRGDKYNTENLLKLVVGKGGIKEKEDKILLSEIISQGLIPDTEELIPVELDFSFDHLESAYVMEGKLYLTLDIPYNNNFSSSTFDEVLAGLDYVISFKEKES